MQADRTGWDLVQRSVQGSNIIMLVLLLCYSFGDGKEFNNSRFTTLHGLSTESAFHFLKPSLTTV